MFLAIKNKYQIFYKMISFLLLIDIIILCINFFFVCKNKSYYYKFKNHDLFFLNLAKNYNYKKYNLFCNYFQNLKNKIILSDNSNKKIINLKFVDFNFHSRFHKNEINKILKIINNNFLINYNSKKPDYLIYSNFGCEHLKKEYNNAIKISFLSENQIPDFNIADYNIGYSHISYLDRYFKRQPYFDNTVLNFKEEYFRSIRNKVLNKPIRKKFCAAVISNIQSCSRFRLEFINELNKYKRVDMGGKFNNNVGKIKNKIKFLSSYKFSIAMENSEGDGYLSEKIIDSFLSGTIPIYYGSYMIDEFINPKSYILIKNEKDIIKKINYIKYIDNNDDLYKNILREKVLIKDNIKKENEKEYIEFINHIFEQDKKICRRINNFNNI